MIDQNIQPLEAISAPLDAIALPLEPIHQSMEPMSGTRGPNLQNAALEALLREWLGSPTAPIHFETDSVAWSLVDIIQSVAMQLVSNPQVPNIQVNFRAPAIACVSAHHAPHMLPPNVADDVAADMQDAFVRHQLHSFVVRHAATFAQAQIQFQDPRITRRRLSEEGEETAEQKRRRRLSAASLKNLEHKKICPQCGTNFGNAKKGICNADMSDGRRCPYVFVVKHHRPHISQPPSSELMPNRGSHRTLKTVQTAFQRVINEANSFALKMGMSVAVFATGCVHTGQRPNDIYDVLEEDTYIKPGKVVAADPKLRIAVLKYSSGGAAKQLCTRADVCEYLAQRALENLASHNEPSMVPLPPSQSLPTLIGSAPPPQTLMLMARQMGGGGGNLAGGGGQGGHPQMSQLALAPPNNQPTFMIPLPVPVSHWENEGQLSRLCQNSRPMSFDSLLPAVHPNSHLFNPFNAMPQQVDWNQQMQVSHSLKHPSSSPPPNTPAHVLTDIDTFLAFANCSQYCEALKHEDIDLTTLSTCGEEDLKNLGLPLGARRRILEAFRRGGGSGGLSGGGGSQA